MYNIKKIDYNDPLYPQLLKLIPQPPKQLYYVGNPELLKSMCIAVVGSRQASEYGKWVAKNLGQRLGENGVTVVSGLARGIDAFGHKGALAAGGSTIAVLGGGIDVACPVHNENLMGQIVKRGLVISEYPPGLIPTKFTFPIRNRIISGLSVATVVVEAGINSGSLITAEAAGQQGRTVFAVPGNITSVCSMGTNKLIYDGAVPLIVMDGVFEELGISGRISRSLEKKLGSDEKAVLEYLSGNGEVGIDSICRALSMDAGRVSGLVTVLEMKGLVYSSLGKIFIAK